MAQVLLLSATPADDRTEIFRAPLQALLRSAERDRFQVHRLTSDAAAAEIILFVESYGSGWHFERARAHPLTRRYREKCFMYCANPFVIPFLPGIYTGIERRRASRRTVTGFYLGQPGNEFVTFTPPTAELPYLYSFVGSVHNALVRQRLANILHPRGLFVDTSANWTRVLKQRLTDSERRDFYRHYADATKASKFVLCPRGLSVSSIRLFETMQMGRAPVILSDNWIAPPGPDYEKFAIRVREKDCGAIEQILAERENEAVAMGECARREWLEWFSDEVAFHRIVEWCIGIRNHRRLPESLGRWRAYLQYTQPFHFKRLIRRKVAGFRKRF